MTLRIELIARQACIAAVVTALVVSRAHAAEFDLGDGKLNISGSIFFGESIRTVEQDTNLLPNVNSSLVGITGTAITPSTGRNQDDGNLNFNRGDPVSTVLKGYLTLDYKWRNYGALASAMAWYDYALADANHPWGNIPNAYAAGRPLSDGSGAEPRSKFSGIVADNLYVYGHNQFEAAALDWRIGYQKLDWGNNYVVVGGLRDLNPIDVPAILRPGVVRDQETRVAFPAIFGSVSLPQSTSIEAFYQLRFTKDAVNECGAFFSEIDFVSEGCNAVMVGPTNDRTDIATGNFIKRSPTINPSNGGGWGIALKHTVKEWSTEFGLYATAFDSRRPFFGTVSSLRVGPPYIPFDPGGLNPKYFTEYPENIRMYGATFSTRFHGGSVFGELTYRPNQPLQYNSIDLLNAFLTPLLPSPLRAQADATAPGAHFSGFERHDFVQAQLGAAGTLPSVLGAAELNLGAEVVYKGVPGLPDPAGIRFGRSDVFGQGPVNGVCPPPAVPIQCSLDGYVSKNAFGIRLHADLVFLKVFADVDLIPALVFGQDISGWSDDLGIIEGRKLAVLSLRANFAKGWTAQVAWQPTWGGTYNNQSDRSTAFANIGYRF